MSQTDKFDGIKVIVTTDILLEEHLKRISQVSERVKVEKCLDKEEILKAVKDAEIIVGWLFDSEIFHAATSLKWFHAASAGVERFLFKEFVESPVILTNSSGIHRAPMAEVAMAFILCFAKNLPGFMSLKAKKKWARRGDPLRDVDELTGKTLGVLGLGNVGMEVSSRGKCFGMRVMAVDCRTVRRPTYVDEVMGLWGLDRILTKSDYLVITVPLTSETRHMIGERELRLMKSDAYLINVSRGAVVDQGALVKALKEGWIAGAGLDVFEEEPLPEDSELWDLENVIITPHISGGTPHYAERLTDIFCENLKRYLEGRPLINLVDKRAGY
ncbi:MAG: D-2-hydroxyacid dehydrogenase [Candidatus Bathyarchaeia archaeon]